MRGDKRSGARLVDQDAGFTVLISPAPFDPIAVGEESRATHLFPVARELAPVWMRVRAVVGRGVFESFVEVYTRRNNIFLGDVPASRPSEVEIVYI